MQGTYDYKKMTDEEFIELAGKLTEEQWGLILLKLMYSMLCRMHI